MNPIDEKCVFCDDVAVIEVCGEKPDVWIAVCQAHIDDYRVQLCTICGCLLTKHAATCSKNPAAGGGA